MRRPYESPKITVVGSVKDLTQANLVGSLPDALTLVTVSIPGVGNISVPGQGTLPPGVVIVS
ncbi:MAG: hypothetical protein DLM61_01760 [Pseudonocardiales bacterium]|nr:MAG: hypothetical protein DLM61_01760 [Pseudonocardiales bacterium]